MDKENLILIGGGGHARACLDVVLSTNLYNVLGYFDLTETLDKKFNLPYLGNDKEIEKYINTTSFLITVGQIQNPEIRVRIFEKLKSLNAKLPVIVSNNAYVSPYARIAEGTIVMHGVVIQCNASIGYNCIINDKALIEHDAFVGNHCHISTGVILNGDVSVSDKVFIGSASVIKNGVYISNNVIIGSGSNVINDVEGNKIVVGNPAKFL